MCQINEFEAATTGMEGSFLCWLSMQSATVPHSSIFFYMWFINWWSLQTVDLCRWSCLFQRRRASRRRINTSYGTLSLLKSKLRLKQELLNITFRFAGFNLFGAPGP